MDSLPAMSGESPSFIVKEVPVVESLCCSNDKEISESETEDSLLISDRDTSVL